MVIYPLIFMEWFISVSYLKNKDVLKTLQVQIRSLRPQFHEAGWMLHYDIANIIAEYPTAQRLYSTRLSNQVINIQSCHIHVLPPPPRQRSGKQLLSVGDNNLIVLNKHAAILSPDCVFKNLLLFV
ncbi:hypothetical protein J6590_006359 [Homalodisca vitripennis]|nr:hypothetical protein J6590_006359 [Homalodisca vitripennis]